jgi:enediyne biosynthesis thioesterase
MQMYEYRHFVTLADTNATGNVYFANYLIWQGRCRELFLRDHAPEVIAELTKGLRLVTTKCSCEFIDDLKPFENVVIKMGLRNLTRGRITMLFEYWRAQGAAEVMVALGMQQIACIRSSEGREAAVPLPRALADAVTKFAGAVGDSHELLAPNGQHDRF